MAEMRVFVSSTCYDLSLLRSQLRTFIRNMGYEPIMSDYEDILYDPRIHTHTSCVDEVTNCDILILIIGSRFGGKATPEALNKVNFEVLKNESVSIEAIKEKEVLSVTQLEVLKAIENSIPVYVFIDRRVWHDHALYEKNKSNDIVEKIIFPSIEKQETAKYIFNFINFVRLRTHGNNVFTFEKGQDIEEILRKQWSGYFQRLLQEQRYSSNEHKRIDILSEQFEDLKAAILSSIENVDQRETARGIVRYRRLFDLMFSLKLPRQYLSSSQAPLRELLREHGIVDVLDTRTLGIYPDRHMAARTILLRNDYTFFTVRIPSESFSILEAEWDEFKSIKIESKEIILDALYEMYRPTPWIRYHNQHLEEFIQKHGLASTMDNDVD